MDTIDKDFSRQKIQSSSVVGSLLRRRREELNQAIEDVSAHLRIRPVHLKAIEAGRMQELPGIAYTMGFVRSYADYLGLEGKLIVADYRDEMAQHSRAHSLAFPSGHAQGRLPGFGFIMASIILIGALYTGWHYWGGELGSGVERLSAVEPVPENFKPASPETAPPETAPSETPPAVADKPREPLPIPSGNANPSPIQSPPPAVPNQPLSTSQNNLAALGASAQTAPASLPAPSPSAPATGSKTVQLTAHQDSWVDIRDANNQVVFSRVLRQGETYIVPDQAGLVLTTGNAGGLEVAVGGKTLPSLGGIGLVRRDIPLDPAKLLETGNQGAASLAPAATPAPASEPAPEPDSDLPSD